MAQKTSQIKVSELDIQRTCSDLLQLDGWRMLRTDPCSDHVRGKGFGEIGMADCLYIRYSTETPTDIVQLLAESEVMWIEWKCKHGHVALNQRIWHDSERARGALTLIAGEDFPASIEGFTEWYRGSGLNRGRV